MTNDATSDYHSLQRRRLSRGWLALASYTLTKSLDIVSEESFQNRQSPTRWFNPRQDRGLSTFDVRPVQSLQFRQPDRDCNEREFRARDATLAGESGGLSLLFQIGGPRSIQLALKLKF